ncbi:DNA polymerase III, delta prime subunit [Devosia sp. YR412]|uniref:AAA family ATPase n=1 Tax=Devosia sp. YR412 TaxID=1881030 RepID=UPI0008D61A16|nr:AAA family ATPase [Devosia sp. YR412]SEQ49646.1 DNA polymerase III, delta prime subunit [Devosia sp. YR412]
MIDPDALEDVLPPERRQLARGHERVRAPILQQLAERRLPGAILLHGPQGIGKATFAFELAAAILTQTGDEEGHRVEEQIAALSHPNLFLLRRRPKDAKSFYTVIRVEDVRELRDSLHHTRGRSGYRVAIIDAIDYCNPSAANALLKTLEEPPPETIFLLISHRPGQLLPTIKSRCHNLALRPVGDEDVRGVLLDHDPALGRNEVDRAIALAGGRPRRAFETLALEADSALGALQAWLSNPAGQPAGVAIALAETLGSERQSTELTFAREMLDDWLAEEARNAAMQPGARRRLASANELWDKAHALFAEADSISLDMKQTLIAIFDAIRKHVATTVSAEPL